MTSCGATTLPADFDIFLPCPSSDKAVGQYRLVGRAMIRDDTGQQGAVEPASMLIRPFEIEIGRPPFPSAFNTAA